MADEDNTAPGCCGRLRAELKCSYPLFSLDELNGRQLDVKATFAPTLCGSRWLSFVLRLTLCLFLLGGIIWSIVDWSPLDGRTSWIFLLTHWTLLATVLYFVLAVILHQSALCGGLATKDAGGRFLYQPESGHPTSSLVRFTWAVYALAMPTNIIVVLLYWTLDYNVNSVMDFENMFKHALTCLLLLVDANFLSCIPLRMKQMIFPISFGVVYVIWTVINSLLDIGDGVWPWEDEDQTNQDDALYSVIDWKHNPASAAVYAVVIVGVVFPLVFLFSWTLSAMACCRCDGSRRRITDGDHDTGEYPADEEAGATEANVY